METIDNRRKSTHHGHAVKRFRQTLGIKQDALAVELGISQAMVSMYESKRMIDDDMIDRFAKVLNVAPQLIKDLEEDPVTVIIENNTFENGSVGNISLVDNIINNNNNPIEQILELNKEKQTLYERMLKLEQEKIALLKDLLKEKNKMSLSL